MVRQQVSLFFCEGKNMLLFKVCEFFLEGANAINAMLGLVAVGGRTGHSNLYILRQTVAAQPDFDKQIQPSVKAMD